MAGVYRKTLRLGRALACCGAATSLTVAKFLPFSIESKTKKETAMFMDNGAGVAQAQRLPAIVKVLASIASPTLHAVCLNTRDHGPISAFVGLAWWALSVSAWLTLALSCINGVPSAAVHHSA
jgi:hypothetical protein